MANNELLIFFPPELFTETFSCNETWVGWTPKTDFTPLYPLYPALPNLFNQPHVRGGCGLRYAWTRCHSVQSPECRVGLVVRPLLWLLGSGQG